MLTREPPNFLCQTDFSLAELAYDGEESKMDILDRHLQFRDLTDKEIESFNIEAASIFGELVCIQIPNSNGPSANNPVQMDQNSFIGTFALIDEKIYQIAIKFNNNNTNQLSNQKDDYREMNFIQKSKTFIPIKVMNIGFANLWEYESIEQENNGKDNLLFTKTEDHTQQNNQKNFSHNVAPKEGALQSTVLYPQIELKNETLQASTALNHEVSGLPINQPLLKFRLSRLNSQIVFGTRNKINLYKWLYALQPYIIQFDIWGAYNFSDLLGQGSYGKVFLATKNTDSCKEFTEYMQAIQGCKMVNQQEVSAIQSSEEEAMGAQSFRNSKRSRNLGDQVAIKIMEKRKVLNSENGVKCLVREVRVHWLIMDCDGVLQLLEIFEDDQFIYLVLEYQKQGSLLKQIMTLKRLTENQARIVTTQLLLTLDFIHQKRIIHRDIKLDNILINQIEKKDNEFSVRIADFGLSLVLPDETQIIYEKCGTPCYVAPEILRGVGYNTKCDIFSMGSLLFNMLTGRFLFKGKDKMEILHHNKQCNLSLIDDYLETVSVAGRNILKQMLHANPIRRPSAKEALSHAWFKEDQEVIRDLLIFNEKLSKGNLVYKQSADTHQNEQQNQLIGQHTSFQNVGQSLFNSFAFGPSMFGNHNIEYVFEDKDEAVNNNSNDIFHKSKNSKFSSRSPQFDTSKMAQANIDSNQEYTFNGSGENSNKNLSDSINHTSGAPEIRKNTPTHEYSQSRVFVRLSYFQSLKDSRAHSISSYRKDQKLNQSRNSLNFKGYIDIKSVASAQQSFASKDHYQSPGRPTSNNMNRPKLILAKQLLSQNKNSQSTNQQNDQNQKDKGNHFITKSKFYKQSKPDIVQKFNQNGSWASSHNTQQKQEQQIDNIQESSKRMMNQEEEIKLPSQMVQRKRQAGGVLNSQGYNNQQSDLDSRFCDSDKNLYSQHKNSEHLSQFSRKKNEEKHQQSSLQNRPENSGRNNYSEQNQSIKQAPFSNPNNNGGNILDKKCDVENIQQQVNNNVGQCLEPEIKKEIRQQSIDSNEQGNLSIRWCTFEAPEVNKVYDSLHLHQGFQLSRKNQPQVRRIIFD